MTRVDEFAAHIRRLGNHELNELLLQLPKPCFAALVEVVLARPLLPAGLVLRFEPAPGVDGWTAVACAPRRPLGTLTRHLDPSGRRVYRAWTRAGDPVQATGISSWRHSLRYTAAFSGPPPGYLARAGAGGRPRGAGLGDPGEWGSLSGPGRLRPRPSRSCAAPAAGRAA